ncbi:FAD-dependent monooxygenase [Pelagibacterium sediminicola]|uniref:FAD-dependent monooxygenase n=1 Tax=Pelagibacterium sediminicola TaxID=2248761 RepID=UPI000E311E7D|nr:FAD-dependent monooxygenase [Pelagibacterium sediminicola]
MAAHTHDVIVVGGGPVGLSLGVALTRFAPGIRVALVDRRPMSVPRDARASAIASGVQRMFATMGVWDGMADKANPVMAMKITDSGGGDIARPVFLTFGEESEAGAPIAHMVPNAASAPVLIAAAGDIDIVEPGVVTGFSGAGRLAEITLEDGRAYAAPLVVAADGGQSGLRKLTGIGVFAHDYRQAGIVTNIAHSEPHEDTAFEHFRPAGPFASLPLKGNFSSLVWAEEAEKAAAYVKMAPADLAPVIEAVMGASLGRVEIVDIVQSFPLRLSIARRFIAPRLALVGDAAHVVHPLAGQGLNLGLKDVAVLAEAVLDAMRLGLDHGAPDVLARYERARAFDTGLMAAATDGLNRLFSNDQAPIRALRDFGLSLVERAGPLKSAIIDHAAGRGGARLLRGIPL